jgi:hypothetical protein
MRKLIILKNLVDFIWIFTLIPLAPLLLFLSVYMFINPQALAIFFDVDSTSVDVSELTTQLFVLVVVALTFVGIYCLYLFRKTLRYFQQVKPFHNDVIKNFYKIGYLLTIIGLVGTVLLFVSRLVLKSQLQINLGISPYLILICLGLFFMVLSEVFKVAKQAKEENELTV